MTTPQKSQTMFLAQNGKVYWEDDSVPLETLVTVLNKRAATIDRLEAELHQLRAYRELPL